MPGQMTALMKWRFINMGDPEDALGGVEGESLRRFLAPRPRRRRS